MAVLVRVENKKGFGMYSGHTHLMCLNVRTMQSTGLAINTVCDGMTTPLGKITHAMPSIQNVYSKRFWKGRCNWTTTDGVGLCNQVY